MVKCTLPVVTDNYSVLDGITVLATALDGGASRLRQDKLGAAATITVNWITDSAGYNYLRGFKNSINDGADPFQLDVVFETGAIQTYVVQLIPGSWKLNSQRGNTYIVEASVEVVPGGNVPMPVVTAFSKQTIKVVTLVANVANFDASLGQAFELLLNANCTSSTLVNCVPGTFYTFCITQDGVGGRTFVWPAIVKNAGEISLLANSVSTQVFYCQSNGNLYPVGPMTIS